VNSTKKEEAVVKTDSFLLPCVGSSLRLISRPLIGKFNVGLSYKVLAAHDAYLVVEDDAGKKVSIHFARFDLSTIKNEES
jgi:hypothetical protein